MFRMVQICVGIFFAVSGVPAAAADFQARIVDQQGQPVPNAVVMLYPADFSIPARIDFDWQYQVAQKDQQFQPHVLIVPEGATVAFPNLDRVRHHVYSFSKPNDFEMKLYGREDKRGQKFDTPGAVAMGCNIHDEMRGFVRVVDTPFVAKSDKQGAVSVDNLPVGAARLVVWHPLLRATKNELHLELSLPANPKQISLKMRPRE